MIKFGKKFVTMAIISCVSSGVYASSFGVGIGTSSGTVEDNYSDGDIDSTDINLSMNFGAMDRMFSWRMDIGYVEGDSYQLDFSGLQFSNAATFRITGNPGFRLWAGPAFILSIVDIDGVLGDDTSAFAYGIGPAIGADFDLPGAAPILAVQLTAQFGGVTYSDNYYDDDDFRRIHARFSVLWGR